MRNAPFEEPCTTCGGESFSCSFLGGRMHVRCDGCRRETVFHGDANPFHVSPGEMVGLPNNVRLARVGGLEELAKAAFVGICIGYGLAGLVGVVAIVLGVTGVIR